VRIINNRNLIIGTSERSSQGVVQKMSNVMVKRTLSIGEKQDKIFIDRPSGGQIWVVTSPIKHSGEVIGAIYLVAKIESVYEQMDEINGIFITGTAIAMLITAILGVLLARMITKPISDMKRQAT